MHLKPLRLQLEDFEQAEFDECGKFLGPLLHTVCLIWSNSGYYNTPARVIVLLQEMCNMIIDMVSAEMLKDSFNKVFKLDICLVNVVDHCLIAQQFC